MQIDAGPGAGGISVAGSGGFRASWPTCDSGNANPISGRHYDPNRDCIETEDYVEGVACFLTPETDNQDRGSDGYSCLRRLADGEVYWTFAFYRLGFDPLVWEKCPDAPLLPPKGCYGAGCSSAPRSTCSVVETARVFACGPENEFDQNCCGRQTCTLPEDCADDEQCIPVETLGQIDCFQTENEHCDCGGPRGGPGKRLCMPEPAVDRCGEPNDQGGCPKGMTTFNGRKYDEARRCLEQGSAMVCSRDPLPLPSCWVDTITGERFSIGGGLCLPAGHRFRYCVDEELGDLATAQPCQ